MSLIARFLRDERGATAIDRIPAQVVAASGLGETRRGDQQQRGCGERYTVQ